MNHIVVVGNGIAGLTAADALRTAGYSGNITIIGEETRTAYSRPALSKSAMAEPGEITAHLLPEPEHGATELLGVRAAGLDLEKKLVQLADIESISYDGLIIASGVRPRKLRPELSIETVFRTLEDATALKERLKDKPSVVVIGGGILGMEVASICSAAGSEVTVISPRTPMLAFLGTYLSEIYLRAALAASVKVISKSATDVRLTAAGRPEVLLSDGDSVAAELIVTAIGDAPNIDWLESSGLLIDGELRVDGRNRVLGPNGPLSDVVAAGDVASIPGRSSDGIEGHFRVPLWTSAIEQAKAAALTLLQGEVAPELNFQPYFWTEQFGLHLKACGALPVSGEPSYVQGVPGSEPALLRWDNSDGTGTAVSLNYRIPVPKLRALSREAPTPA